MTAYDDVLYDSEANTDAHPRAMATTARLFGVAAAPVETASVLEIGCGNGENLVAAATYLPNARFVGFDLAARAIEIGRALASTTPNVELTVADVRDEREVRSSGTFDFVIAHGLLSWVPADVRAATLGAMRKALKPNGVGFLSVNAMPGWESRRALRWLARTASAGIADPAKKVAAALAAIGNVTREPLASTARAYEAHVKQAMPPGAPYSRYVFHDLLAECNDPFSLDQLTADLRAGGLRVIGETPLRPARGLADFPGLAADLARTGLPFLQVLVTRDDVASRETPALDDDMFVWCDFVHEGGGMARTAGGARARIADGDALWPAVEASPGFLRVGAFSEQGKREVFEALSLGILRVMIDPPAVARVTERPKVAPYVLAKARAASDEAIVVDALHRGFRLKRDELALLRKLDGETVVTPSPLLARLARHAFLVP